MKITAPGNSPAFQRQLTNNRPRVNFAAHAQTPELLVVNTDQVSQRLDFRNQNIARAVKAIADNDAKTLDRLLKTSVSADGRVPEGEYKDYPFLIYAVLVSPPNENIEVVETLLKHQANIDGRTKALRSALMWTIVNNDDLKFATLLEHQDGKDPAQRNRALVGAKDINRMTPLMYSVIVGNHWMTQKLLDHGADVFTRNREGKNSLDLANELKDRDMARILVNDLTAKRKATMPMPKTLTEMTTSDLRLAAFR